MSLALVRVRGARELTEFIRFPNRLHRASPWYVPPLEMERRQFFNPGRNPFFAHATAEYFIVRDGKGGAVGRISAHTDRHYDESHGPGTGFFGFFDAEDDPAVAGLLFGAAGEYLRSRGVSRALGPMNFTTNHDLGTLVEGFDGIPCIMMPWNPPGYDALIRGAGFAKERDLFAYLVTREGGVPENLARIAGRVRRSARITHRTLDLRRFREELGLVKRIYNDAWAENWGFVPMTDPEIAHMAKELKPLVDPALLIFTFVEGEIAGFFLAVPDYNLVLHRMGGKLFPFGIVRFLLGRRKIDRMRVLTMGVLRRFRGLGLETLMIDQIVRTGLEKGYSQAEISWILEDNRPMNAIAKRLCGRPYRTYRVYQKPL